MRSRIGFPDRHFRVDLADTRLQLFFREWFRFKLDLEVDLLRVGHIHWFRSAFSRQGTVRVTLWDRPTTFHTEFIDARPDDSQAKELGWFRAPDLVARPEAHRSFIEILQPRVRDGIVTSSVNLETFEPLEPNGSPMPGLVQFDHSLIYDPHLADTARRMEEEERD